MRKSRFTESQIVTALKSQEQGKAVDDICRELQINRNTFYNWKKRYGGMEASELKRVRELEEENFRLKRMYANLSMDHEMLKEIMEKNFPGSVKGVR
jgi:putative transposase